MPLPEGFQETSVADFKFTSVGMFVRGRYLGKKVVEVTDEDGTRDANRYVVDTGKEVIGFWGNYHLDDAMIAVRPGDLVYVERVTDKAPTRARMSPAKQYIVGRQAAGEMQVRQVPDGPPPAGDDDIPF